MNSKHNKVPLLRRYRLRFARKKPPTVMWEALLVVLFGAVMIYAYSFTKKLTYGADAEAPGPTQLVRVQVLNGCGLPGAAGDVADKLRLGDLAHYQFDVVDQGNFATYDVTETLVLDRGNAREAALRIAEFLGTDQEHVLRQPLADNVLDIEVSVILGRDFPTLGRPTADRRP